MVSLELRFACLALAKRNSRACLLICVYVGMCDVACKCEERGQCFYSIYLTHDSSVRNSNIYRCQHFKLKSNREDGKRMKRKKKRLKSSSNRNSKNNNNNISNDDDEK